MTQLTMNNRFWKSMTCVSLKTIKMCVYIVQSLLFPLELYYVLSLEYL